MPSLLRHLTGSAPPDAVHVVARVQVFELMRKQEETRLTELEAEKVQYAIHERLRDMVSS